MLKLLYLIICGVIITSYSIAQKPTLFKIPSPEIIDLATAPSTPKINISPNKEWMLLAQKRHLESIQSLAKPEINLGGTKVNPINYSQSRENCADSIWLLNCLTGKEFAIANLPNFYKLRHFAWSPNNQHIAFTNTTEQAVELWILNVQNKKAKKLTETKVNNSIPITPLQWLDAGEWIVFSAVIEGNSYPPNKTTSTEGPIVRDSKGKAAPVPNYQYLLKDSYDVELFDFYTKSQLQKISINQESYPIGIAASFKEFSVSPDGRFILVKMIKKPYSYLVPYKKFPYKIEIWDNEGTFLRDLFKIPPAESIPSGIDAVRKGPRDIAWRNDLPASLHWVRALDGGDPNRKALFRDRLYFFDSPFDGEGYESVSFSYRLKNILWGNNELAICTEQLQHYQIEKVSVFNPSNTDSKSEPLFEYNYLDANSHPGHFMTVANIYGRDILAIDGKSNELYMKGKTASTNGYKPFIDKFNLTEKSNNRIWQSNDPYYENPVSIIDVKKDLILTLSETISDPPNYFSRNLDNGVVKQLSNFTNPYPQLNTIKTQLLKYKRKDNIKLSGKLYLPPEYSVGDGLLPVIIWVKPSYYANKAAANQIKDSPNKFIHINWNSPLFWLTQGYAVLDNTAIPIIRSNTYETENNFIEQLVTSAQAAINCLDSLAIVDKSKITIGGHGHGAFVAANLMAHTELFAAGIARSGFYNLSLTPFGYEGEEQSFWQARETYINNSPFSFVHKINNPLLLIHGIEDDHQDTQAMQSERLYKALKGHGAKARLVILPHESHEYKAEESILHMLWETGNWLNKHVNTN